MVLTQDSSVVCSDGHVLTDAELRLYDALLKRCKATAYRHPWLVFFFGKKHGYFEITICQPRAELPSDREAHRLEVTGFDSNMKGIGKSIRRVCKHIGQIEGFNVSLTGIERFYPTRASDDSVYLANCKLYIPKI